MTVVYASEAEGVQYAVVPEDVGAVALVTAIPPALYPVPVTSPVDEYVVVLAFTVAEDKYSAALKESAVVPARTTDVPKA